jgi:hypothetical protein
VIEASVFPLRKRFFRSLCGPSPASIQPKQQKLSLRRGEKRPCCKTITNSHPFGSKRDSLYMVSITSFHFLPWLFPFAFFVPLR